MYISYLTLSRAQTPRREPKFSHMKTSCKLGGDELGRKLNAAAAYRCRFGLTVDLLAHPQHVSLARRRFVRTIKVDWRAARRSTTGAQTLVVKKIVFF